MGLVRAQDSIYVLRWRFQNYRFKWHIITPKPQGVGGRRRDYASRGLQSRDPSPEKWLVRVWAFSFLYLAQQWVRPVSLSYKCVCSNIAFDERRRIRFHGRGSCCTLECLMLDSAESKSGSPVHFLFFLARVAIQRSLVLFSSISPFFPHCLFCFLSILFKSVRINFVCDIK